MLPALIWMGVIYISSGTPDLKSVPLVQRMGLLPESLAPAIGWWLEWVLRKSAHLLSYALLALLLLWAFSALTDRRRALRAALLAAVLYAVSDELHQAFVPGRQGRWYDVAIDTAGAWAGLWAWNRRRHE